MFLALRFQSVLSDWYYIEAYRFKCQWPGWHADFCFSFGFVWFQMKISCQLFTSCELVRYGIYMCFCIYPELLLYSTVTFAESSLWARLAWTTGRWVRGKIIYNTLALLTVKDSDIVSGELTDCRSSERQRKVVSINQSTQVESI